jgi:hypothetical protein
MTTNENNALVGRLAFEEVTFPNDGLQMTAFMLLSLEAVFATGFEKKGFSVWYRNDMAPELR